MRAIISTRGLTISTTYKDALTRKLEKLERLLPGLIEATIVLSREKHRRTAALGLVGRKHTFRAVETADDMAEAVDLAVAALGRQVRQVKDRARPRKTRRPPARIMPAEPPGPSTDEGPVVVRRIAPKPMSVEEAVEQLRLRDDQQFMVFTNAGTNTINVLYRRTVGGLGLIEPRA
jgi:putative sigma-54 modulation protein